METILTATLQHKKPQDSLHTQLAFSYEEVDKCYLNCDFGDNLLWIGSTCFDVRPDDVDQIVATFHIRVHGRKDAAAGQDMASPESAAAESRE